MRLAGILPNRQKSGGQPYEGSLYTNNRRRKIPYLNDVETYRQIATGMGARGGPHSLNNDNRFISDTTAG